MTPRGRGVTPRRSPRRVEAFGGVVTVAQRPQQHLALAPAHLGLADLDQVVGRARELLLGRVGDVELMRRALGHALQARGGVRRVAERGVLEPPLGADVARHHRPGVQADAHLEAVVQLLLAQPAVERLHPPEHVARGLERPIGMVLLLQRRAEDGHDAVAHVGHERAAVVEDRLAHLGQVAVERLDHALRLERLREAREPAQVAEHDRRLAAHAAQPDAVGGGQDLVDHGLGDEARERVAGLRALEGDREPVDAPSRQDRQHAGDDRVDDGDDRAAVERELDADQQDRQRRAGRSRRRARTRRTSSATSGVSTDIATTSSTFTHSGPERSGKPSHRGRDRDGLDLRPGHQLVAGRRGRVAVLQPRRDRADDHELAAHVGRVRAGRSRRRRSGRSDSVRGGPG